MRGNRIAATRSHCSPIGGCGWPTTRWACTDTESSVSSQKPSSNGMTPYVGLPVSSSQLRQPGREQGRVAAKLVDQKARNECLVLRREHRHCSEQVREQPATVDVADQDDRQVRGPRQSHVGQIGCPQVDLGGRSGTLADDGVELAAQCRQFVGHQLGEPVAVLEVVGGTDRPRDSPAHHQL